MRPSALSVYAKCLLLLACLAAGGCSVTTSHPRTADVDYSDADHYNRPHAPSPDYRGAGADSERAHVPKRVYPVRDKRARRAIRVEIVPAEDE